VTVLLLRHGRAGGRRDWDGPDQLRPLSKRGRGQATALVELFDPFPVKRILCSPYLRCLETVEPLAEALGVEIERRRELGEASGIHESIPLLRELAGTTGVVCTHGDIVPAVLEGLAEWDGMLLPDDVDFPKGSTWVLDEVRGRFQEARYLPPPE
jgi:phosphohistidine phosphatase SixA